MIMFDYKCSVCSETFETLAKAEEEVPCPKCQGHTERLVSAPRIALDGCDPAFPTAWGKWEKTRKEKAKKQAYDPDWGINV